MAGRGSDESDYAMDTLTKMALELRKDAAEGLEQSNGSPMVTDEEGGGRAVVLHGGERVALAKEKDFS